MKQHKFKSVPLSRLLSSPNVSFTKGVLIPLLGLWVMLYSSAAAFAVSDQGELGKQVSGAQRVSRQVSSGQVSSRRVSGAQEGQQYLTEAKTKPASLLKSPLSSGTKSATSLHSSAKPFRLVVLNVDGVYLERPDTSVLSFSGVKSNSLMRFTSTIRRIARDKDIDALLLNFEQPMFSWAQVDDFRQAIYKLRKAGKKTYAYVESPGQIEYLLACACDKVIMTPAGSLEIAGLAGETMYFKGLFDKLGIEADFIHIGNYKGASEPLTKAAHLNIRNTR